MKYEGNYRGNKGLNRSYSYDRNQREVIIVDMPLHYARPVCKPGLMASL